MDNLLKNTIALSSIALLVCAVCASVVGTAHSDVVNFTYAASLVMAVMYKNLERDGENK